MSAIGTSPEKLRLRVGCEFGYEVGSATPAIVQVRPHPDSEHLMISETWTTTPVHSLDEYVDIYGNLVRRLVMRPGDIVIGYEALCEVTDSRPWHPEQIS